MTRDLVNGNADDVTPEKLAQVAQSLSPKIKVTVFDKKRIEKEEMGLLLAVARSSFNEPKFRQYMPFSLLKGRPIFKQRLNCRSISRSEPRREREIVLTCKIRGLASGLPSKGTCIGILYGRTSRRGQGGRDLLLTRHHPWHGTISMNSMNLEC